MGAIIRDSSFHATEGQAGVAGEALFFVRFDKVLSLRPMLIFLRLQSNGRCGIPC